MKTYRTEIHSNIFEVRIGDLGGEYVLVNGRLISRRPFGGWLPGSSHHLQIDDETRRERNVEVRVLHPTFGIGQTRVLISVDGVERCRLEPIKPHQSSAVCTNCGYSLIGLAIENGEVRCPECGRHSSANLIGVSVNQLRHPEQDGSLP